MNLGPKLPVGRWRSNSCGGRLLNEPCQVVALQPHPSGAQVRRDQLEDREPRLGVSTIMPYHFNGPRKGWTAREKAPGGGRSYGNCRRELCPSVRCFWVPYRIRRRAG